MTQTVSSGVIARLSRRRANSSDRRENSEHREAAPDEDPSQRRLRAFRVGTNDAHRCRDDEIGQRTEQPADKSEVAAEQPQSSGLCLRHQRPRTPRPPGMPPR